MAGRAYILTSQAWAALALVCAATGTAAAQSAPQVLFQQSYDRSGGATDVYQGSVATCDPTGSYRLVVDNGVFGPAQRRLQKRWGTA